MIEAIVVCFIAAVITLDRTAFGQFMISRPIVCAPIFGYMLGDIKTGLWMGMIIELMWVNIIPMGQAIPQDETAISILSVIWGLKTFPGNKAAMIIALAIAIPCGSLFKQIDILLRYYNIRVAHWVEEGVISGRENRIDYGIYIGILLFFLKAFLFFAVLYYPGQWFLMEIFSKLSDKAIIGLELAWTLLPISGMGFLMVAFYHNKFPGYK